jgi:hypothetical protein
MDSHGLREAGAARSYLEVYSLKSKLLAWGVGMTMMLAGFLDDNSCLLWCVRGLHLVVRVVVCVHATLFSMTVGKGCLYRFLAGFPLINHPTLFSIINENSKSFASFQKKNWIFMEHNLTLT